MVTYALSTLLGVFLMLVAPCLLWFGGIKLLRAELRRRERAASWRERNSDYAPPWYVPRGGHRKGTSWECS